MSTDRIPVTIVGGYLGAGKTTLVNHILTGDHGRRIAVIVNDFGDVAIDDALLEPATGGVRALANGCVCCSAVDGLAVALGDIASLDPPAEHVVIEVSGVGDPWAVAQWGRTPGFELDGVVVVADPELIQEWADDRYVGEGVRHQLEVADIILLSRADVTSGSLRNDVAEWISLISGAPVLHGTDVPLSFVLGPAPTATTRAAAPHASHTARTLRPVACSRAALTGWLESAPDGVVRVKGFVAATEDDAVAWLAQRVGRRVEVVRHDSPEQGAIVVISTPRADGSAVDEWAESLT